MRIDIWSDVACPWCYIGKRELERAIEAFDGSGEFELFWHSFELDPDAPAEREGTLDTLIAKKYRMTPDQAEAANGRLTAIAAGLGLEYRLDIARACNTFDAHRLVHYASTAGLATEMKEALFAAYLTFGQLLSDHATLVNIAGEVGLDEDETRLVLATDAFGDAVRHDEAMAENFGFTAVPTFVIDQRFAIAGAQDATVLLEVINQAFDEPADSGGRAAP